MKVSYHPLVRQWLVAVLVTGIILGSTMLPLSGAETRSKKSSAKTSSSSTPKKKSSASPSPSAKSKSSPAKASPTKATPRGKKAGTTTTKKSTTTETEDSSKPAPGSKAVGEDTEAEKASEEVTTKEEKSPPSKATSTPAPEKMQAESKEKKEIPGQPAPALPNKESGDGAETTAKAEDQAPKDVKNGETAADDAKAKAKYGPNVSIGTDELLGFAEQPPKVQQLIEGALQLASQKLTYKYGSADPNNGGMDCSGAIHYILKQQGFEDVPRDASGQYVWARKNGQFFAVVSKKADSFEFGDLLPGDLLFWSGTYRVDRDPPVTHSMIYLGVQKKRGQHVMWGSSDGRTYDGKPRWGVSVFDFKMPRADKNNAEPAKADFLGYARIPGLRQEVERIVGR